MSVLRKILTVFTFALFSILNSGSTFTINSSSSSQSFSLREILVHITHEESMKAKTYTKADFQEIQPDKVTDLEPEKYQAIVRYLNGETIDDKTVNVKTYERWLVISWDEDLTEEQILQNISILEKRSDISHAQPNFYYELAGGGLKERYDYVKKDIWTNYYYIKVISKEDRVYAEQDGLVQMVIEAELKKSYNKIVSVENESDQVLSNILKDNKFKFIVPKELYLELNVGYEYIIKLDSFETLRNRVEKTNEQMLKYEKEYYEFEFMRVINNRLYYTSVERYVDPNGVENKQYIESNLNFYRRFNYFIFKKTFVKNELPFEFEIEVIHDFAGDQINIVISDEEKAKVDPDKSYIYYYYKTGVFLFTGDNVLMFDEYIKLAKGVAETGNLYEPEEVQALRQQAFNNILNSGN